MASPIPPSSSSHQSQHSVIGYAAHDPSGHLQPFSFTRRATGDEDVTFKVEYCGICHSDLHQIKNEWKRSIYPMVPGHEIVGIVTEVGSKVRRFKVGDKVGVGCIVNSCASCDACSKLLEQFCPRVIYTFNHMDYDGTLTAGGYSNIMVVPHKFAFKIPTNLPLDEASPLLCAGITVYSPMKYFGFTEAGKRFGVVGLGGLGHMAVKFGKAFGLHVTVISTSPHKEKEAKEILGVDAFIVSKDEQQMKDSQGTLDYILDTVSADHPLEPLLSLLTINGKYVVVGVPEDAYKLHPMVLMLGRRFIGGGMIGGTEETQEMLDFCGTHNITATIEKIPIDYVNTAMERLVKGDVKYRFVIDIAGTLQPQ